MGYFNEIKLVQLFAIGEPILVFALEKNLYKSRNSDWFTALKINDNNLQHNLGYSSKLY